MMLLVFDKAQHEMLEAMLKVAWDAGYITEECRRIRSRVEHALTVRIPPKLIANEVKAQERGRYRRIVQVIATEHGVDALMLECGHVVARHHRAVMAAVYCEACVLCQPLESEAADA